MDTQKDEVAKVTPEMKLEKERLARQPAQATVPNEDSFKSEIAELSSAVADRDETIENITAAGTKLQEDLEDAKDNITNLKASLEDLQTTLETRTSERDEETANLATAKEELATTKLALEEAETTE